MRLEAARFAVRSKKTFPLYPQRTQNQTTKKRALPHGGIKKRYCIPLCNPRSVSDQSPCLRRGFGGG